MKQDEDELFWAFCSSVMAALSVVTILYFCGVVV